MPPRSMTLPVPSSVDSVLAGHLHAIRLANKTSLKDTLQASPEVHDNHTAAA
jgi:hypothetical protein